MSYCFETCLRSVLTVAMLTSRDGCFKRASLGGWNRWLEQHKEGEATEQRSKGAKGGSSIRRV